jgi:hypothetical protein
MMLYGENVQRNRGVLCSVLLSTEPQSLKGKAVHSVELVGLEIFRQDSQILLEDVSFISANFINSGFTNTVMRRVTFSMSRFDRLKLRQCSLNDVKGLAPGVNISGLIIDGNHEFWGPQEIIGALERLGWENPNLDSPDNKLSARGRALINITRRFAAKTRRTNNVVLDADDHRVSELLKDGDWNLFKKILIDCRLALEETMPASGPRKLRLRITVPADVVLDGRDNPGAAPQIRAFWDWIERL